MSFPVAFPNWFHINIIKQSFYRDATDLKQVQSTPYFTVTENHEKPVEPPTPKMREQPHNIVIFQIFIIILILLVLKSSRDLRINMQDLPTVNAYDHTTMNTPVLVRSPKLSIVGPGQYLDG